MPYLGLTARSTALYPCTTNICNIIFNHWCFFCRGHATVDNKFVTSEPGLLRCTELYRAELTSHAFFKV